MPGSGKPFNKGNRGRPPGSPNKVTRLARENFTMAFEALGGMERMVQWANADPENLKVFFTLYARLIPMDVTTGGNALPAVIVQLTAPDGDPKPEAE